MTSAEAPISAELEAFLTAAQPNGPAAVLAAVARRLAGAIDAGEIPSYALPGATRELRACLADLDAGELRRPGLTDKQLARLLGEDD